MIFYCINMKVNFLVFLIVSDNFLGFVSEPIEVDKISNNSSNSSFLCILFNPF